ncbi:MAG: YitT family protein [Treponema sp.]|nr:YitT family protein [Treponema sp.]
MIIPDNTTHTVKRILLIIAGSVLMAFNINTFVNAGGLIPGGFTGLSLLIKESAFRFSNIDIPFSVIFYTLNVIPAIISFRFIGKWFTLYSCLMILISGLLTDWMPSMFIDFLQFHDMLLSAVFGGLLNAGATILCLMANATSGGTDFIAIFMAERYGKDAWNYIFAGNCVVLVVAAYLFAVDKALYSIIFQFTTTITLNTLYHGYQQKTLLIITNQADAVYKLIRDKTNHDATTFTGIGQYKKTERILLYSVVAANEVPLLVNEIRKVDPASFINILKTERLTGRFYKPPKD